MQTIEVYEAPDDRHRPALILESNRMPANNGNGRLHGPCNGCGGHQAVETGQEAAQPPPYLMDIYQRHHLVGWMESNLLRTHQAVRESEDVAYANIVIRSSLEAFLDVVEEVMFRCDELAAGLPEDEEAGQARCPIAGVYAELETKLVFYDKELRFLYTTGNGGGMDDRTDRATAWARNGNGK